MQNFLGLLEHEEADFVEQVKKSKAFIQKIIKDKEDLGVVVALSLIHISEPTRPY